MLDTIIYARDMWLSNPQNGEDVVMIVVVMNVMVLKVLVVLMVMLMIIW